MKQEIVYDNIYVCQVCSKGYMTPTDENTDTHKELACMDCGAIEIVPRTYIG